MNGLVLRQPFEHHHFLRRIDQNISGQSETISLFAERPAASAITGAIGPDILSPIKGPLSERDREQRDARSDECTQREPVRGES